MRGVLAAAAGWATVSQWVMTQEPHSAGQLAFFFLAKAALNGWKSSWLQEGQREGSGLEHSCFQVEAKTRRHWALHAWTAGQRSAPATLLPAITARRTRKAGRRRQQCPSPHGGARGGAGEEFGGNDLPQVQAVKGCIAWREFLKSYK